MLDGADDDRGPLRQLATHWGIQPLHSLTGGRCIARCGPEGSRTPDLRHAEAARYQLRYRPLPAIPCTLVGCLPRRHAVRSGGQPYRRDPGQGVWRCRRRCEVSSAGPVCLRPREGAYWPAPSVPIASSQSGVAGRVCRRAHRPVRVSSARVRRTSLHLWRVWWVRPVPRRSIRAPPGVEPGSPLCRRRQCHLPSGRSGSSLVTAQVARFGRPFPGHAVPGLDRLRSVGGSRTRDARVPPDGAMRPLHVPSVRTNRSMSCRPTPGFEPGSPHPRGDLPVDLSRYPLPGGQSSRSSGRSGVGWHRPFRILHPARNRAPVRNRTGLLIDESLLYPLSYGGVRRRRRSVCLSRRRPIVG